MAESYRIERITRGASGRRSVFAVGESSPLCTLPNGFKHPYLRVGRELAAHELEELRAAIRAHEAGKGERKAARTERATAARADGGTITRIREFRGTTYISLDGVDAFEAPAGHPVLAELRIGQALSAAEADALAIRLEKSRAVAALDELLAIRDRAEGEVTQRLGRKGFGPAVIAAAIEARRSLVLPDIEFAKKFARQWSDMRGKSPSAAYGRLRELGVDPAAAREGAAQEGDVTVREHAADKLAKKVDLADRKSVQRFIAAMARRGWSYGDAKTELERLRGTIDALETEGDEAA
jgi:SOS response regulatory protein OraA/RecX